MSNQGIKKQLLVVCLLCMTVPVLYGQKHTDSGKKDTGKNTATTSDEWKKGDQVEVQDANGWLLATILEVKNLKYQIHFETQTKSDIWVMSNRIRKASAETIAAAKKAKSSEKAAASATASSAKSVGSTASTASTVSTGSAASGGAFKVGDKIEVSDFGQWQRGTVQSIRTLAASGQIKYMIAFDNGGTKEFTEGSIRQIADYNTTGKDFKKGQYIYVWYSNEWRETQIKEIKDGKMLITYGGSGEQWWDLADTRIRNKVKEEADRKAGEERSAFAKEVSPYTRSAGRFLEIDQNSEWANPNVRDERKIEDLKQCLVDLAALDKIIKEKYSTLPDPKEQKSKTSLPSVLRDLSSRRNEIAGQVVARITESVVAEKLKIIKEKIAVADGVPGGGTGIQNYSESMDKVDSYDVIFNGGKNTKESVKKYLADFYRAAGLPDASESILAEFDKTIAASKTSFNANLPAAVWNVPNKDATIEGVCKKFLSKEIPGAVVLKSGVEDGGWEYEKTESGIILSRRKWADIQWKDPKTGLCCISAFLYMEDALINGSFQIPGYITNLYGYYFTWAYQRCN